MAGARRRREKSRFPLRLEVLFVGKAKSGPLAKAIEEMARRIGRYARLDLHSYRLAGSAALGRSLAGSPYLALDPGGRNLDSAAFRQMLERRMETPGEPVRFLIGGADGIPTEQKRLAAGLISLSELTLSHDLARFVLFEQIYRALASMAGSPYAR